MLCPTQLIMLILGLSTVTLASSQISQQATPTPKFATSPGELVSSSSEHRSSSFKPARAIKSGLTTAARNSTHQTVAIHKPENNKPTNITQTTPNDTHKDTLIASASLLRPSFIRGLLGGGRRGLPSGRRPEEDTEEVTQTIMVPVDSSQAEKESQIEEAVEQNAPGSSIKLVKAEDDQEEEKQANTPDHHRHGQLVYPPPAAGVAAAAPYRSAPTTSDDVSYASNEAHRTLQTDSKRHQQTLAYQPKAEASLQLTSTEMSSLLNDREAPAFYRERELSGDGVLVGEEPARLGTAASGHFHSHNSGLYGQGPSSGGLGAVEASTFGYGVVGGGGGVGDSEAAIYSANQHRLNQAASEEADYNTRVMGGGLGGSSFNNRFGRGFPSASDVESNLMNGYGADGRLMQSPNEYNEISSYGNGPPSLGAGFAGYPNSPVLDRHASEIYNGGGAMGGSVGSNAYDGQVLNGGFAGAGGGGGGAGGDMYGGLGMNGLAGGGGQSEFYSGRLGQAASHNPYSQGDGDAGFGDPRLGGFNQMGAASYGADHRNEFGASNALMSQQSHGDGQHRTMLSGLASNDISSSNRLMPLSPTIPVADDLYSLKEASSNQVEPSSSPAPFEAPPGGRLHHHHHHHRHQQPYQSSSAARHPTQQAPPQSSRPQVHEAIEDDPTDVSQADEQGSGPGSGSSTDGQQQAYNRLYMTTEPTDSDSYAATSTINSLPQLSELQQQQQHQQQQQPQQQKEKLQAQQDIYHERNRVGGAIRTTTPINLVLNVPPPAGGGHQRLASIGLSQQGVSPMVEFSRVGSAGYLGPQSSDRRFVKKSSTMQQVSDARMNQQHLDEYRPQYAGRDPIDNPAHAGKYIID